MANNHLNIVCVGGGTAGHVNPALSVLSRLILDNKKLNEGTVLCGHIITDYRCAELIKILDPAIQGHILHIPKSRQFFLFWIIMPWIYLYCLVKSIILIYKIKPDVIIGFGGYVSFFPIVAARILGCKKIIVHEQNTVVGKANEALSYIAKKIALSFHSPKFHWRNPEEISLKNKMILTGNPIRQEFIDMSRQDVSDVEKNINQQNNSYLKSLNILIYGGSQGAKIFDTLIPQALSRLKENTALHGQSIELNITQQHAGNYAQDIIQSYANSGIHNVKIQSYFHNLPELYKQADLLICRGGGSTIFEIIASAKPAIIVPLPTAQRDHQAQNAKYLSDNHAAWVIRQSELDTKLAQLIFNIIQSPSMLSECRQKLIAMQEDFTANLTKLILQEVKS